MASSRRIATAAAGTATGQALPLVLGAALLVVFAALGLVALGGAVTGAARAQRASDVIALSAARSMRDDLPRLLAPARLPNGLPNPLHLDKQAYLRRASAAALEAAERNGVARLRIRVTFPDRLSFAPLQARVALRAELDAGDRPRLDVEAHAVAEAAPALGVPTGRPAVASGAGYSGPLAYRQGEPMRPDVAAAFDRLASAAAGAGQTLIINSAYRSDAEQAALFARNPDPRMVARPGHSLHRCGTELDLGPVGAYGWLAANARRFGFVQRYSWEPWHYGYVRRPEPCAAAAGGGDGRDAGAGGLPSFVPAQFRAPLERAAARWNVSAALLAAQLLAESNFDPGAVSPAGAQGIAQFMPATAALYGLADPFRPAAAIDAQAHLMSDLLRRQGSVALALAAYNAGSGAVDACGCVPDFPETRAYVDRILALLTGAGKLLAPPLEVRLVD